MKAVPIEQVPDLRRVDAHWVVNQVLAPNQAPELFAQTAPGGFVRLPNYMEGRGDVVAPSLEVTTFRGNQARLVDLHTTDPRLDRLYRETAGARGGMEERLTTMVFDGAVRMLDTSGAQGLHHLHRSRFFPNTIYYATSRGSGVRPHVYMTRVGDLALGAQRVPVLGLITATKDPAAEHRFFKIMGGK